MDLNQSVAVVTGASTGIGRAIAVALSKNGCRVALLARSLEGLSETEGIIRRIGGLAVTFPTDLRDEGSINKQVSAILSTWGKIDIIINVAGVWHDSSRAYYGLHLHEIPSEELNEVLDVGIRASMHLTRLGLPSMVDQGAGKIINISGTFQSAAGWLHYYVSKKAIEQFTIGLAEDVRQYNIQANCICPADVATESLIRFFPDDAKLALGPDDVASMVLLLVTSPIFENITGQVIVMRSKNWQSLSRLDHKIADSSVGAQAQGDHE